MRYFPATALKATALAALAALPALAFDGRPFADATGRDVLLPENPARVFAAGPPASTLLYISGLASPEFLVEVEITAAKATD